MNEEGKKFVVISHHRSGSTMFVKALDRLPSFMTYGELFILEGTEAEPAENDMTFRNWLSVVPENVSLSEFFGHMIDNRTSRLYGFLDEIYAPAKDGINVGFKLLYNQLQAFFEILDYIDKHGIYMIHLMRRNHIKGVLSAKYRRFPTNENGRHIVPPEEILLAVRRRERRIEENRSMLKIACRKYIEFFYEDITGEANVKRFDETLLRRIFKSLDLEMPEFLTGVQVDTIKRAPLKISQYMANYREFKDHFMKFAPRYAKFFEGENDETKEVQKP